MDIIKIFGGVKNTIIICLCLFLGYQAYTIGSSTKRALKQQHEYQLKQQSNMIKLNRILGDLAQKNAELTTKLAERDEKVYEMRMDMGKSIREFNRKVKELKKIETPEESVKALHDAWSK